MKNENVKELLKLFNEGSKKFKEESDENFDLIEKAVEGYDLEDVKVVVKRNRETTRFNRLFDKNFINNAVRVITLERQLENANAGNDATVSNANNELKEKEKKISILEAKLEDLKKQSKDDASKSLDILSSALVKTIKETKGDELIDFAKTYIKENYGIEKKKIVYETPKTHKQFEEVTHEEFENIISYVQINEPVMLVGPAGTGKNILVKQVAKCLDMKCYGSNAVQNTFNLTGFIDANGKYQETEFYKACKSASDGNETIFYFDEFDGSNSEVTITFNNAIANGEFEFPNGTLKFGEKLHFVACANTYGKGASFEYCGRNQLDDATLDRFANVFIDYSPAIEDNICQDKELLSFVRDFRKCKDDAGIKHIVSYRGIKRLDKKLSLPNTDVKKAIKECLLKNLEGDDLRMIVNNLENCKFSKLVKEIAENE